MLKLPQIAAEVAAQLNAQGVRRGELAADLHLEQQEDGGVLLTFTLRNGRRVAVTLTADQIVAAIRAAKSLH